MILYSNPKLPDFYTLSQTTLLENHTFNSGMYSYGIYMRALPFQGKEVIFINNNSSTAMCAPSRSKRYFFWKGGGVLFVNES